MAAARNDARVPANEPVIELTRLVDAPRELVWDVFTDPKHLAEWWGPTGFTITTHSHAARAGAKWEFVMHGPDGTDYDNRVTYEEVVKPERLVYQHGEPNGPIHFHVTITFTPEAGKTRVVMRSRFPSLEERDHVVREFHAVEGGKQTLNRLEAHLAGIQLATDTRGLVKPGVALTLTRVFDAPRDLVFSMWIDEKHMQAWWGPAGSDNGETRLDARPGGQIHIQMRGPGFDHPMGGEYLEIDRPKRLVFLSKAFQNPDGSWKFVNHNTVTFEEAGGKTKMTIHCVVQTGDEGVGVPVAGMEAGWNGSLDRLHDLLTSLR